MYPEVDVLEERQSRNAGAPEYRKLEKPELPIIDTSDMQKSAVSSESKLGSAAKYETCITLMSRQTLLTFCTQKTLSGTLLFDSIPRVPPSREHVKSMLVIVQSSV
ncbi:MAG: hypothetical protein NVS9B15_25800 [Acidobacteriaceae bacterium]